MSYDTEPPFEVVYSPCTSRGAEFLTSLAADLASATACPENIADGYMGNLTAKLVSRVAEEYEVDPSQVEVSYDQTGGEA